LHVDHKPYTFPRSHRISTKTDFTRVYDARVRESRGPLTIYALPNELGHPRLGLSVGRRVGNAPRRNRVKRLLREAFRFHQYDLPAGYDLVITVRPHEPLGLADYDNLVAALMLKLHKAWERRRPPECAASDPA
jgi:ribonuclease P protein component